jgi:hypothetical protein
MCQVYAYISSYGAPRLNYSGTREWLPQVEADDKKEGGIECPVVSGEPRSEDVEYVARLYTWLGRISMPYSFYSRLNEVESSGCAPNLGIRI